MSQPNHLRKPTPDPEAHRPNPAAAPALPEAAGHTVLETWIDAGLSAAPPVTIPRDFAARVSRLAVAQVQPSRLAWLGWGPRFALGSGVLLTLALFALAPHATPSLANAPFDAELILLTELGALLLFAHRLLPRP